MPRLTRFKHTVMNKYYKKEEFTFYVNNLRIYYIYMSLNRKTGRPLTEWMPWKWMTTSL